MIDPKLLKKLISDEINKVRNVLNTKLLHLRDSVQDELVTMSEGDVPFGSNSVQVDFDRCKELHGELTGLKKGLYYLDTLKSFDEMTQYEEEHG